LKFRAFSGVAHARLVYSKGNGITTRAKDAQIHLGDASKPTDTVAVSELLLAEYLKKNSSVIIA